MFHIPIDLTSLQLGPTRRICVMSNVIFICTYLFMKAMKIQLADICFSVISFIFRHPMSFALKIS